MTPADLAELHAAAFAQARPWSAEEFAALLDQPQVILLGDVRSFLLGRQAGGEAELLTIATHPKNRRLGLANNLIASFLAILRDDGVQSVFLEVAEDNQAAKLLYLKAGFLEAGRRPRYYARPNGTKVAAIVMRCDFE